MSCRSLVLLALKYQRVCSTTNFTRHPSQEVMMIDVDWRQPFIDYIREQKVPTDKNLAEQLICQAKS
jgi:hypothetical protein